MYEHYIRIDEQNRIIDAFTTAQRLPEKGDIYLHDGGPEVEIFPRQPGQPLSLTVQGHVVWLLSYEKGSVRSRTKEELEADMPPVPPAPDTGTRLADAEADIAVLLKAINIMTGGN